MTERSRERDAPEDRRSRRHLFDEVLGDAWIPQGDGTYRLVNADAPLARDDSHKDARPDPIEEAREREHWFLPRRH
jgi:hypothetical protein